MFDKVNTETRLRSTEKEQALDEKEIKASMSDIGLFMAPTDWDWIRKRFGALTKPGIHLGGWTKVFMGEATPAERKKDRRKSIKVNPETGEPEAVDEEELEALKPLKRLAYHRIPNPFPPLQCGKLISFIGETGRGRGSSPSYPRMGEAAPVGSDSE